MNKDINQDPNLDPNQDSNQDKNQGLNEGLNQISDQNQDQNQDQNLQNYQPKSGHTLAFAIMSLLGAFLFLVPIPDGEGAFNIPLGFAINWLGENLNSIEINGFGLVVLMAMVVISISFIGSALAYVARPDFIMENEKLRNLFLCHPVYFVSKTIAVILGWMVYFAGNFGEEFIESMDWLIGGDGAGLMTMLISEGGSNLMTIFIILGFAIPILTDFGFMEFLGILIRKCVRALFTLPGRSSIDLLGSWFSSSAASVIITRDQLERGYYTGREAAAICVNFTLVSLPFTFVVAGTAGVLPYFPMFYLVICVTAILLAIVMPRIWPLRGIKDEYLPDVGKQIVEDVPPDMSTFSWAVKLASKRASQTTPESVIRSGFSNWLNIFMDLIPVIMAWGTIALVIQATTPIFDYLSLPFAFILGLFQVQYIVEYPPGYYVNFAPATVVGFADMFIPAVLLGAQDAYENFVAPLQTRFILGALSIVQIIYMAETGILILKSKIPLNIGHLAIIFVMRTVFALPVIILLTWLLL